jgi:ABC-type glycerol-3-phosphate transport system substrate-binding protein
MELSGLISRSNAAGDNMYDVAFPQMRDITGIAGGNQLCDIKQLPYVDLTKPWWTQHAVEQLSVGNRLYFTTNDICVGNLECAYATLFNKDLVQRYNLENLYGLVTSGKWTLDKLYEMCAAVMTDTNSDGKYEGFDDQFGIDTFLQHGVFWAYLNSAGEYIIKKNANDYPELAMNNERFYSVYDKILEIIHTPGVVADANQPWMEFNTGFSLMFTTDKTLFCMELMQCIGRFREMETNFGVIPFPKYDENQKEYYTYSSFGVPLFVVPVTNPDPERTGIIVEALAAESHKTVKPAYIDVALGNKYLRDDDSTPMIEIILDSRVYDLAYVYQWGGIGTVINQAMAGNNKNPVSIYEKYADKVKAAIDKTIELFREN